MGKLENLWTFFKNNSNLKLVFNVVLNRKLSKEGPLVQIKEY